MNTCELQVDDINRHADIGQTIVEEVLPYSPEYYLGVKKDPEVFLGDPRGMQWQMIMRAGGSKQDQK